MSILLTICEHRPSLVSTPSITQADSPSWPTRMNKMSPATINLLRKFLWQYFKTSFEFDDCFDYCSMRRFSWKASVPATCSFCNHSTIHWHYYKNIFNNFCIALFILYMKENGCVVWIGPRLEGPKANPVKSAQNLTQPHNYNGEKVCTLMCE